MTLRSAPKPYIQSVFDIPLAGQLARGEKAPQLICGDLNGFFAATSMIAGLQKITVLVKN